MASYTFRQAPKTTKCDPLRSFLIQAVMQKDRFQDGENMQTDSDFFCIAVENIEIFSRTSKDFVVSERHKDLFPERKCCSLNSAVVK